MEEGLTPGHKQEEEEVEEEEVDGVVDLGTWVPAAPPLTVLGKPQSAVNMDTASVASIR